MTELFSDEYALARDAGDPLSALRAEFHLPRHGDAEQAYFCGNSLGLQPKGARAVVDEVMDKWAREAVEGHFREPAPWMPYHALVRDGLAKVVGAEPSEVVAMNSLTANLHFLMVSFYRPTRERPAILMEAGAFPSDRYALESQVRFHGFDPATDLIELEPDEADGTFSMAAIERAIATHGPRLALVLWPGVQYRTGQAFDLAGDIVTCHHIEHHINTTRLGDSFRLGHKVLRLVVDGVVRAQRQASCTLVIAPSGGNHGSTEGTCQLNSRHANATRTALHQERFTGLQTRTVKDIAPHREERLRK